MHTCFRLCKRLFSWSKHSVNSNRLKENTAKHLISIIPGAGFNLRLYPCIHSNLFWHFFRGIKSNLCIASTMFYHSSIFKMTLNQSLQTQLNKNLFVISSGDCLLDPPEKSIPLPTELPGHTFGLDRQCQQAFGDEYTYCPNAPEDQACAQLWCREEGKIQCTTRNGSLPWADGTPCGEDRRCREGLCVSSALEEAGEEKVCVARRMRVCASSRFITLYLSARIHLKHPCTDLQAPLLTNIWHCRWRLVCCLWVILLLLLKIVNMCTSCLSDLFQIIQNVTYFPSFDFKDDTFFSP